MTKILQISDLHILPESDATLLGVNTEYYFHQVLATAHAEHGPFDLILVTGDLAQDPCPASYRRILAQLQFYRTKANCLPGNHDDLNLMQEILNQGQVGCKKQLLIGGWQIICLNSQKPDSPVGRLADTELEFLDACLKTEADRPALIALHHHCIASGCTWLDTMQIENSAALLERLDHYPQIKLLTYGHVHKAIASEYRGVGIFSAPSTCFQFELHSEQFSVDDAPPGYRVFELSSDGGFETACYRIDESPKGLSKNVHSY